MLNKQYKGLTFKQALAGYYGYMQSMIDGTRVFASSLLTGRSIDTFSKVPIDDSIWWQDKYVKSYIQFCW